MAGVVGQVTQVSQAVYNTINATTIAQYPYLVKCGVLKPTYVSTASIFVAYYENANATTHPHSAIFYSRDPDAVMKHGIQSANGDFNSIETIGMEEQDGNDGGYYWESNNATYGNPQFTSPIAPFSTRVDALNALRGTIPTATPSDPIIVRITAQRIPTPGDDPNAQGGYSGVGGGTGDFDETSDPVLLPTLPPELFSAANAGLVTIFAPSITELRSLSNYLWTSWADVPENLKRIFNNPMDYFISLHLVPLQVATSTRVNVKLGLSTTNVSMAKAANQFVSFDCGNVELKEYWGSALDYAPNTKVSIVLPFIGDMTLDPDVVMGRTLNVSYFIDLLSGACVAFIRVNGDVLYQFQGNCAAQAPLTGADFSRIYAAAIGAGMTLGAGIVAGIGAGSAAGAATTAKNLESISEAGKATASLGRAFNQTGTAGKGLPGVASMRKSLTEMAETVRTEAAAAAEAPARVSKGTRGAITARAAANTVREVMGGKMTVSHTGSLQGNTGIMGIKVPYLIVERPSQSLAENYKHYVGYPSNIYATLGSLTGYTECEQVVVSGINCTDGELSELEEILKGGFYL